MKKFTITTVLFLFINLLTSQKLLAQSHQLFSELLNKYVKNGLVDYKNLKNDDRLDNYLAQLSNTNSTHFTQDQKLAFWINTYNAFTLKVVSENYPIKSITELHTGGKLIGYLIGKTVWDKKFIIINNEKYSLNDIEHKILRQMNEPRIHFAIVCASISCPSLSNEAFNSNKLEVQLEKSVKKFINDSARNHFDLKNRKAYISKIFSWFNEDFGTSDDNILKFISNYLPYDIQEDLKKNFANWSIVYKSYDWNLNEIKDNL